MNLVKRMQVQIQIATATGTWDIRVYAARQTDSWARLDLDAEICVQRHVKTNLFISLSPQVGITCVYNTGMVTGMHTFPRMQVRRVGGGVFGHLYYLCVCVRCIYVCVHTYIYTHTYIYIYERVLLKLSSGN